MYTKIWINQFIWYIIDKRSINLSTIKLAIRYATAYIRVRKYIIENDSVKIFKGDWKIDSDYKSR